MNIRFVLAFFFLARCGLTKSLVLEGKKSYYVVCLVFARNHSFVRQWIWTFPWLAKVVLPAQNLNFLLVLPSQRRHIQTQIYRVSWHFPLATPWFFFCPSSKELKLKRERIYEDCVLWFRVLAIFSTKLHLFPLLFAPSVEPIRAVRETPPQSEQSYFKKQTPPCGNLGTTWPKLI